MASRSWPLTVRQEAGVPTVPPTFAVRGATRARVALAALSDRLGLPMQVLLERLLGVLDAPALCALVELDIPDRLDRPRTAAELATETGSDAAMLDRLLSYLASRGCLRRDRKGRYSREPRHPLAHARRWVERLGAAARIAVDDGLVRADHRRGPRRHRSDRCEPRRRLLRVSRRAPRSRRRVPRRDGRRRPVASGDDRGVARTGRRTGGARCGRRYRRADLPSPGDLSGASRARCSTSLRRRPARARCSPRRACPIGPGSSPATSSRRCRRATTCTC